MYKPAFRIVRRVVPGSFCLELVSFQRGGQCMFSARPPELFFSVLFFCFFQCCFKSDLLRDSFLSKQFSATAKASL